MKRRPARLREKLDRIAQYYGRSFLGSDPVQFPHRYHSREDREIVAFLASAFAYGSVKQIGASVERILEGLETIAPTPADAVRRFRPPEHLPRFEGFRHRFNDARDLACLLVFLRQMLERCGSIEGFFASAAPTGLPLRDRLVAFTGRALSLATEGAYAGLRGALPADAGVRFFFPSPADGSACKRLCMFLRWVARPADGVDLGLWTTLTPAELVMPLDTHTTRICYWNGLSPSPFATWRNAEFVTNRLRAFDANDPIRYDFALSRLGILRVGKREAQVRVANRKTPTPSV
jgi:uncharacterized protein (TIGR02757 family)